MKRSSLLRRSNAGFTLTELMLVTVMSSLSLSLIFYFLAQNSRLFNVQEDFAQMQYSLQFAADRIESDIQRAGFMIPPVPLAQDQRYCTAPITTDTGEAIIQPGSPVSGLVGINFQNGSDNFLDANPAGHQSRVSFDRLDVFGNITSNQEFLADILDASSLRIYYDATVIPNLATFQQVFLSPNQFYRVLGMGGKMQIVQAQSIKGSFGSTFTDVNLRTGAGFDLNLSPACGVSISGAVRVVPLLKIGYRVLAFPVAVGNVPATATLTPGANPNNLFDWRLVRVAYQADCQTGTPPRCTWNIMDRDLLSNPAATPTTPHPPIIIANNVVDLQFFFTFRNPDPANTGIYLFHPRNLTNPTQLKTPLQNDNAITFPPSLNVFSGVAIWPASTLERLSLTRSVFFRLSIRTENDDANINHVPRTSFDQPILTFNRSLTAPGAAKVRSIVRHVQLLNFAN